MRQALSLLLVICPVHSDTPLPEQIGPYRILSLLGEGSSGRVYLAQESSPQRRVALKVLRAGTDTLAFQARFRREIEILGGLEHPGIARLYASGIAETAAGPLPYLALEYVCGSDLIEHAQQHNLSMPARLQLMSMVCEAVHYAHTRGVVHRDLKPRNIWVDEQGQPKVLDFGIAHVVHEGDGTQVTRIGEVLGTLAYMSWEQLTGEAGAADPRSDVFSLGVVSYQLLAGQAPFQGEQGATLIQTLNERRHNRPPALHSLLPAARGDVDTMVMKAMAFDASERYGSAAEFAADLRRYLDQRPIEARPPTVRYVVRLFVRRHKALAASALLAAAALLVGTGVAVRYGLSEAQARQEAELRLSERDAVSNFLTHMLEAADPDIAQGEKLTALEVVAAAQTELEQQTRMSPAVALRLHLTLGNTFAQLGEHDRALSLLAKASTLAAEHFAPHSAERIAADFAYAKQLETHAGQVEQAAAIFKTYAETLPALAGEAGRPRLEAQAWYATALAHSNQARTASPLLETARAQAEAQFGPNDPLTLQILAFQSFAYSEQEAHAQAVSTAQTMLARTRESFGPEHSKSLDAINKLAIAYTWAGDEERSLQTNRESLELRRKRLGAAHPEVAWAELELSKNLIKLQRSAEALPLLQAVLPRFTQAFGATHHRTLNALNALSYAQIEL